MRISFCVNDCQKIPKTELELGKIKFHEIALFFYRFEEIDTSTL